MSREAKCDECGAETTVFLWSEGYCPECGSGWIEADDETGEVHCGECEVQLPSGSLYGKWLCEYCWNRYHDELAPEEDGENEGEEN
jgi:hypothetical protein